MREKLLKEYAMAAAFAQEHRDDNPDRLLLSAARWPEIGRASCRERV